MSKRRRFSNAAAAEYHKTGGKFAMQWEVEQKLRLSDLPAAEAKLNELGVTFANPILQTDHYFNHPSRDFRKSDEALRLRRVGADTFITYKGPKIDPATKTRRELELPLGAGTKTPDQFAELLLALGFRPAGTVKKTRRTGKMAWNGHEVEVALDHVENVGSFLELEIAADDSALEAARAALKALSQQLAVGSPERRSYLELLPETNP
jgi:adenylate cyclase class 2